LKAGRSCNPLETAYAAVWTGNHASYLLDSPSLWIHLSTRYTTSNLEWWGLDLCSHHILISDLFKDDVVITFLINL
jgi:hypothetical protein